MYAESELCNMLKNDYSHFVYHNDNDIVLNISNEFDVYFNFTHMLDNWKIGNLKLNNPDEMVKNILTENIPALNIAREITIAELVERYGNFRSHKIFDSYDYKAYLLNKHIDNVCS